MNKVVFSLIAYIFLLILTSSFSKEDIQVKKFFVKYEDTFAKHDPNALANLWTKDSQYINVLKGVTVSGRAELIDEFTKWFKHASVDTLTITINEINLEDPDQAVVKGVSRLSFKNSKHPLEHAFSALLTKDNNEWQLKIVRQIEVDKPASNHEQLKDLQWLIGNWIDKDDNVSVETETRWDKYKNFIIQHFTMKLYNQDVLEGKQVIAWDPIQKVIRSWVFDSDGTFGEGIWSRDGNQWFAKMSYTLGDGEKASAVQIYTSIDNNNYTWSAESRDVNGEILPNIKPVSITRMVLKEDK